MSEQESKTASAGPKGKGGAASQKSASKPAGGTSIKPKTTKPAAKSSKLRLIPISSGLAEIKVSLLDQALAKIEKEIANQNRNAKDQGVELTASDLLAVLIQNMGSGPTIRAETEVKRETAFTIPAHYKSLLEKCAEANKVTVGRVIEELVKKL